MTWAPERRLEEVREAQRLGGTLRAVDADDDKAALGLAVWSGIG